MEAEPTHAASVLDSLRQRHANSKQPESQAIVATIAAISEVLQAQKLQPTPVSVFAAAVAALPTGDGTSADAQVRFVGTCDVAHCC